MALIIASPICLPCANHVSLAVGMLNRRIQAAWDVGPRVLPFAWWSPPTSSTIGRLVVATNLFSPWALGGRHQPRLGVQFPLSMIKISPTSSRALDLCCELRGVVMLFLAFSSCASRRWVWWITVMSLWLSATGFAVALERQPIQFQTRASSC